MLDWISITLSYHHHIRPNVGEIISTDANDKIIWRKKKRCQVNGKHNSCIFITDAPGNKLHVEGNFAKFLQGHNLFGSGDLLHLVKQVLIHLINEKILNPNENDYFNWFSGNFEITRVDCTLNWRLPSYSFVLGWLRQLSANSKLKNLPPNLVGNTVYFSQNSRHWSFKFYSKHEQLLVKRFMLPKDILHRAELLSWSQNILRGELTLRNRKLKNIGLAYGYQWEPETFQTLAFEYLEKIRIASKRKMEKIELSGLPCRLKLALELYSKQYDLKSLYPPTTFYRLRKELLLLGIDISSAYAGSEQKDVDLADYLSSKYIAKNPEFATGTYLWS